MTGYPVIMNGDHAEFEAEWAASGKPDHERPDWPLPSFDAQEWAKAFCKLFIVSQIAGYNTKPVEDQEGLMIGWFANALMRGFDEHTARTPNLDLDVRCERGCTLKKINERLRGHS